MKVKDTIKKMFFIAVFAMFLTSAYAVNKASIKFDTNRKEFKTVKESDNKTIAVDFMFENNGTSPLVIIKASPSCNCLRAEYPKTPIAVGAKGVVRVIINTKGQKGEFSKTVILKTNTEKGADILRIAGVIE